MNRPAIRNLVEIAERQLVLGLDPGVSVGRVGVFQPAIRIGDFHAVIVVDLIALFLLSDIQVTPHRSGRLRARWWHTQSRLPNTKQRSTTS